MGPRRPKTSLRVWPHAVLTHAPQASQVKIFMICLHHVTLPWHNPLESPYTSFHSHNGSLRMDFPYFIDDQTKRQGV